MAKVEMLELDTGMSQEEIAARQKKLEGDGYLLISQSGYTMFYESTDEQDKEMVIKQHNQYINLLKKMNVNC